MAAAICRPGTKILTEIPAKQPQKLPTEFNDLTFPRLKTSIKDSNPAGFTEIKERYSD